MTNLFDIYKMISTQFQTLFFNVNVYDIIKTYSTELTGKAIIYSVISDYFNKIVYDCNTLVSDGNELLTNIDILLRKLEKDELTHKKLAEFLNNEVFKELFTNVYTIYGYLLMKEYDIEKIKTYEDEQLKVFFKNVYTDIIYSQIENLMDKFSKLYNKDLIEIKDVNKLLETIKKELDNTINKYNEEIKIL